MVICEKFNKCIYNRLIVIFVLIFYRNFTVCGEVSKVFEFEVFLKKIIPYGKLEDNRSLICRGIVHFNQPDL